MSSQTSTSSHHKKILCELVSRLYPFLQTEQSCSVIVDKLVTIIDQNQSERPISSSPITEKDAILITYPDHICDRESTAPSSPSSSSSSSTTRPPSPLAQLAAFCREQQLSSFISIIHCLPFHPSTGYDGYAVTNYDSVDEVKFGTWRDFAVTLRQEQGFALMFDLVLNHCSSSHPRFVEAVESGNDEIRSEFAQKFQDGGDAAAPILKARDESSLFYTFKSSSTSSSSCDFSNVWCTYHRELVDWNWSGSPQVMLVFVKNLLETFSGRVAGQGPHQREQCEQLFRAVRLDAFGYVWKEQGTSCVNHPKLKVLLRLIRTCLLFAGYRGQDALILPSITNVTMKECIDTSFGAFGNKDDEDDEHLSGQLSYHLPLPALLLHTLHSQDVSVLSRWLGHELPEQLSSSGRQGEGLLLNLSSTHDGVGLTWCKDILTEDQRSDLVQNLVSRGGIFKTRKTSAAVAANDVPWEVCVTTWTACAPSSSSPCSTHPESRARLHVRRFLSIQSIVVALKGIPAFYMGVLLASENAFDEVERIKRENPTVEGQNLHCAERAINRGRFSKKQIDRELLPDNQSFSTRFLVFQGIKQLMMARKSSAAFHPTQSRQFVYRHGSSILVIVRENCTSSSFVMCFINMSSSSDAVYISPTAIFNNFLTAEQKQQYVVEGYGGVFTNLVCEPSTTDYNYCKCCCCYDLRFGLVLEPYQYLFLTPGLIFDASCLVSDNDIRSSLEATTRKAIQHSDASNSLKKALEECDLWKKQLFQAPLLSSSSSSSSSPSSSSNTSILDVIEATINKDTHDEICRSESKNQQRFLVEDYNEEADEHQNDTDRIHVTILQHAHPLHKTISATSSSPSPSLSGPCRCFNSSELSQKAFLESFAVGNRRDAVTFGCPHVGTVSGVDGVIDPSRHLCSEPRDDPKKLLGADTEILILCSPFCRSIQTAIFLKKKLQLEKQQKQNQEHQEEKESVCRKIIRIKVLEELRAMDNMHSHSRRLPLNILKSMFADQVDFSDLSGDEDEGGGDDLHYQQSVSTSSRGSNGACLLSVESRLRMENRVRVAFDKVMHEGTERVPRQHEQRHIFLVAHFSFLLTAISRGDDTRLHYGVRSAQDMEPIVDTTGSRLLHEAATQNARLLANVFVDTWLSRL